MIRVNMKANINLAGTFVSEVFSTRAALEDAEAA